MQGNIVKKTSMNFQKRCQNKCFLFWYVDFESKAQFYLCLEYEVCYQIIFLQIKIIYLIFSVTQRSFKLCHFYISLVFHTQIRF